MAFTQSLFELGVGRPVLDVGDFQTLALAALRLISEALLVPMRLHAFAALMLGNFRFASFFERAHSDLKFASSDSTIRWPAMQISSRCDRFLTSILALH
jgi:hypothetical protein